MNAKKVKRKQRLVHRLERELDLIQSGKVQTDYQQELLENGKEKDEAFELAVNRHMERLNEAREGL